MQKHTVNSHNHQFDEGNPLAHKKILFATILTAVMTPVTYFGVLHLVRRYRAAKEKKKAAV